MAARLACGGGTAGGGGRTAALGELLQTGPAVALTGRTARDVLLAHPRGAYTTARSVDRTAIYMYGDHMSRLASSLQMMHFGPDGQPEPDDVVAGLAPYRHEATLEPALRPLIASTMCTYLLHAAPAASATDHEMRITMLVSWSAQARRPDVLVHVADLVESNAQPCLVEVDGAPRPAAASKDSQWIRDRQALEAGKSPDANEVLLQDADGRLYEGLTSNFFVVLTDPEHGDCLITAPEGAVLRGTIRQTVVELAPHVGLRLVFSYPLLVEAAAWSGAFVTSTSRLVLPVDRIRVQRTPDVVVPVPLHPKVARLRQLVRDSIRAHCTRVLDDGPASA